MRKFSSSTRHFVQGLNPVLIIQTSNEAGIEIGAHLSFLAINKRCACGVKEQELETHSGAIA